MDVESVQSFESTGDMEEVQIGKQYTVEELLEINKKLVKKNKSLKELVASLQAEIKTLKSKETNDNIKEESIINNATGEEEKITSNIPETLQERKTSSENIIIIENKEEQDQRKSMALTSFSPSESEDNECYNLKEQNATKRVRTMIRSNNYHDFSEKLNNSKRSSGMEKEKLSSTLPETLSIESVSSVPQNLNFTLKNSKEIIRAMLRRSEQRFRSSANEENNTKEALTLLRYTSLPSENNQAITMNEFDDIVKKIFERAPNDALPRGLQGSLQRDSGYVYTVGDFYHNIEEDVNARCIKIAKSSEKMRLIVDSTEQQLKIDEDVGDTASLVACGAYSTLIVSDQGIVIKGSSLVGGRVCVGVPNILPAHSSDHFTLNTKYILGRRLVKVACGPFHFAAISDANEVILWEKTEL